MSTLDTHYTHGGEPDRYAAWERAGAFCPHPGQRPFSMILPPPNITGSLHMGHAYEHTISDAFIRHQRMLGRETLWLPGTDHAGIATQALMERMLAAEGTSRQELGRDEFLARTRSWRASTGEAITTQMRRLGASPDWSRATYTLDPGPSRATHEAFTQLFEQGLIYRAERATSWCTGCSTSLADIETEDTPSGLACNRCGSPIEIRSTPQWYLATAELAAGAREALESGALRIDPPQMAETYLRWLDDMRDWCLSRQLWWGHRMPIWYGPDGQARSFGPGREIDPGWTQDEDTLDTWFSSALWPLSTLGWPDRTADLDRYYPNDLLITGYDLMFFWAIRMSMLCTHLTGTPPFRRLYLHGMIRDERGKKMSKSFGNTIDPLEFTDEFGPDALRLALCRRARPGADIPFGRSDLLGAQALLKKLWSIARLSIGHGMRLPGSGQAAEAALPVDDGTPPPSRHILDRWLASRLERTREATTTALEAMDLAAGTDAFAQFILADLSELYLEARKPAFADDPTARATLAGCLGELLLLMHPFAPFLTEELWEALGGSAGALDTQAWPAACPGRLDPAAEEEARRLRNLLHAARAHRAAHGVPAGALLPARAEGLACGPELFRLARLHLDDALDDGLAGTTTLRCAPATLTIGAAPGPGREALGRQLQRARARASTLRARLTDASFRRAAPHAIQDQTATQLSETLAEIARLEGLKRLP